VHGDGVSHVSEIREDTPLSRSYTPIFCKYNGESKKRKREIESSVDGNSKLDVESSERDSKHDGESHDKTSTQAQAAAIMPTESSAPNAPLIDVTPTELSAPDAPPIDVKPEDEKGDQIQLKPGTADDVGNFFYLLKPHTSGAQKVLIPLSPTDSLQNCLRNQVVLEFPTIQVLSHPPVALPSNFILEDDYLDKSKKERDEMQRLVADIEDPMVENFKAEPIPNASDILATLEKDISGSLS
jgi:hypothetical protein